MLTSFQPRIQLRQHFTSSRASKDYLQILQYAARLSESAVNTVLGQLLRSGELPTLGAVEVLLQLSETPPLEDVHIDEVELTAYDLCLLFIHPRAPNLINLRSAGTMPA